MIPPMSVSASHDNPSSGVSSGGDTLDRSDALDSDAPCAGQGLVPTIGWKEHVALPELGIPRLKAKIDTGARTSALHVSAVEILERFPDGTVAMEIRVPLDRRGESEVTARVTALREMQVTDSGGHAEVRPVIETALVLGPVCKRIQLTLTDRGGMLFRMLLGRKALEGDFLVDVAGKYLMRTRPRRPRPLTPPTS